MDEEGLVIKVRGLLDCEELVVTVSGLCLTFI